MGEALEEVLENYPVVTFFCMDSELDSYSSKHIALFSRMLRVHNYMPSPGVDNQQIFLPVLIPAFAS
jgi:hypothetical protein